MSKSISADEYEKWNKFTGETSLDENMTRAEAIEELKYSIEMVHFNPLTGETSEWLNEENQRYVDACNVAIKSLEQAQWIPVSDRLPEGLMVKTLVSCEDADGLPISTMVASYYAFSKTWNCEYKVIAWMPLPEPYKAESEAEDSDNLDSMLEDLWNDYDKEDKE